MRYDYVTEDGKTITQDTRDMAMLCRKCQSWFNVPSGTKECPVCGHPM